MPINAAQVVESVTGVVQSVQGGAELGGSSNAFDGYLNLLNLAGTIAGTSPVGVGLNAAAAIAGTVGLTDKFLNGQLTADVMSVTGGVLGTVVAVAAVSGAPITAGALAIAAAASIVGGPGVKDWFNDSATGLSDAIIEAIKGRLKPGVDPTTNTSFQDAQNWIAPRDPLVLDLDNDGIEAVGINPAAPVLFDMDGDGIKTATGWIKADDGMVVLDLNGNGLIDSGRELFGDSTVLTRGPRAGQNAANGYEALADLDINGDGAINSLDAAYASLRIWQDANQDGISQANELRTLSDAGIASLSVIGQASNVNLGNGNTQPFSGTFTRTDGSTGASGVAEVSGSLLLAGNNFYREFTDNPALTTAATALPQMRGSGVERDLREAMSLGQHDTNLSCSFVDRAFVWMNSSKLRRFRYHLTKNRQLRPQRKTEKLK